MVSHAINKTQDKHFDLSKIILGFTGSIGSGCTFISGGLQSALDGKYKHFKLSSVIEEKLKEDDVKKPTIDQKQDKGNELRKKHGGSFLASELIAALEKDPHIENLRGIIIDGIKNVKEVQFLRQFPYFFSFLGSIRY